MVEPTEERRATSQKGGDVPERSNREWLAPLTQKASAPPPGRSFSNPAIRYVSESDRLRAEEEDFEERMYWAAKEARERRPDGYR